EAPSDVALAQVAPGHPPGEEGVVVRIERAADVDDPPSEDLLEQVPLLRELTDRARLALLGVDILVRAGHVEVPAQDQIGSSRGCLADEALHGLEKPELGRQVLAAVRDVDRADDQ